MPSTYYVFHLRMVDAEASDAMRAAAGEFALPGRIRPDDGATAGALVDRERQGYF